MEPQLKTQNVNENALALEPDRHFIDELVDIQRSITEVEDLYTEIKTHFDEVKNSKAWGSMSFIHKQCENLISLKTTKFDLLKQKLTIKKYIADLKIKQTDSKTTTAQEEEIIRRLYSYVLDDEDKIDRKQLKNPEIIVEELADDENTIHQELDNKIIELKKHGLFGDRHYPTETVDTKEEEIDKQEIETELVNMNEENFDKYLTELPDDMESTEDIEFERVPVPMDIPEISIMELVNEQFRFNLKSKENDIYMQYPMLINIDDHFSYDSFENYLGVAVYFNKKNQIAVWRFVVSDCKNNIVSFAVEENESIKDEEMLIIKSKSNKFYAFDKTNYNTFRICSIFEYTDDDILEVGKKIDL